MKSVFKKILQKLLVILPEPSIHYDSGTGSGLFLAWRWGWIKGWVVRFFWKLSFMVWGRPRISVGKKFCLMGRVTLSGPGLVQIGDDVIFADHVTPFTHSKEALIKVGHHSVLRGTRLGCQKLIEIGDYCRLADTRIMDTDFHPVSKNRWGKDQKISVAPVVIKNNVGVGASSAILKGVTIGAHSVVAFGSIVVSDVETETIVGGNPAKFVSRIPEA